MKTTSTLVLPPRKASRWCPSRLILSALAVVAFAFSSIPHAHAQAYPTWQGSGTNWSDAANWNVAYAYGQLQWTGGGNATSWNDLSSPQSQWRFYFDGSTAYTLGGSAVHFFDFGGTNGGILSGSTATQTINMDLSFRDNGSRPMFIVTTNSGGLTFGGQIELTNSMTFLGIIGTNPASAITFNGPIVGNKGIVIGTNAFNNTGTLGVNSRVFFNGSNSYTGTTTIRRGTLAITNGNSLSTNTVILSMPGNAGSIFSSFDVNGTTTAVNNFAFADAGTNSTINVTNGAAFTISGNLINETGSSIVTKFGKGGAGTLILAGTASTYSGQMQIGAGTVVIGTSGAYGTNNSVATRGIDLGLSLRDVNETNNVSLLLSNGVTLSNSIYVSANTISGTNYTRTVGIAGSGSATINNQIYLDGNLTTDVGSGKTLDISGNLTNTGGIIKIGTGTLILSAANTNSGAINVSNGVVLVTATRGISQNSIGTTVRAGAAMQFSNDVTLATTNITIFGSGIANDGAIRTIGGSNQFNRGIVLGSDSRIQADAGTYLVISNFLAGATSVEGTGFNLTVGGDGNTRILVAGGSLGTIMTGTGGSLTKVGNGTLNLAGSNNYTGATTVSGGRLQMYSTLSDSYLSANIVINGGELAAISGSGNSHDLVTNTAAWTITSGSYTNNFLNQTMGSLSMSGGAMNLVGANITVAGAAAVTGGAITNSSASFGRVWFDGGLTLGGATFSYDNALDHSNNTVRVSNSLTYSSTNTAAAWFTNTSTGVGRFQITSTNNTNTFDIADAASVTSEVNIDYVVVGGGQSLVKSGGGVLTLGGTQANTYDGLTMVTGGTLVLNKTAGVNAIAGNIEVGTGGTLLISASNQVADTSAVTLSGGTIKRGSGVTETFGDLNLTAASFIDYGSGAADTLTFGTYSPTFKLSVNNFLLGNVLRFTTDLSGSINNASLFAFDNGFVSDWNTTTPGFFTITAIPEPTTYAAAAGLLGLMLYSPLRRRLRKKRS